jgi:hypothetical protein
MTRKIFAGGQFLNEDIACRQVFTPEDFSDEHKQIAATTEQFAVAEIQPVNTEIEAKTSICSWKNCGHAPTSG